MTAARREVHRLRTNGVRLEATHGAGATCIEVLIERHLFAADTIAIAKAGTTQHHPFMIVVDRHIGGGIQRRFVVFVVRTRNGHFTVQVDTRTFGWEEAAVKLVIGPTVVEGEVIRTERVPVVGVVRILAHRVQVTPHRHLRLHIGQGVMHIPDARAQRVVFVDREAQRDVCTIAFVGIVRQIRIVRVKVIIEDTTAEAHTVYGEVRVGHRQLGIGLVVVFGAVDPDSIAST